MRYASEYIDRVDRESFRTMFGGEHQSSVLLTLCSPTIEEQSFIHPSDGCDGR